MFLRPAAVSAMFLIGLAFSTGPAAAQYYPYPERPAPYRILPPMDIDDEDGPVMIPPPYQQAPPPESRQLDARGRPTLPYPVDEETYVPPPPGFIYPDRDAAPGPAPFGQPAPFGHMPGAEIQRAPLPEMQQAPGPEIQRGDIVPDSNAPRPPAGIGAAQPQPSIAPQPSIMTLLPPEDQPEVGQPKELPPQFRRAMVDYRTKEPAGTIVIDTPNTYLYLVLGNGKAMRYGIGVGREGFTWTGTERVSRMAEWPDWHPPEEMIERQPYLPRFMAGGEGNPLGARALYLGKTLYRIHGTNQPSTIGSFVSSGCVRLVNGDIEDLYQRVQVGTRVVVLPGGKPAATAQARPSATAEAR
jgi:lipoprotein-anchoring transpeptidase ErfK/SrfK